MVLRDTNATVSPIVPDVCDSDGRNLQPLGSNRHCQVLRRIQNEVGVHIMSQPVVPQAFMKACDPEQLSSLLL